MKSLRVVLATGIYPPDIGGPATHVRDVEEVLRDHGHEAVVLALWDERSVQRDSALVRFPRRWPWPIRFAAVVVWLVLKRRRYDVVYATGLQPEAVLGCRLAGRPAVAKVVGDPAWERGVRQGLTTASFDEFAAAMGGPWRLRLMRWIRNWWTVGADRVVVPSRYLQEAVHQWVGRSTILIPNGVRTPPTAIRDDGAGGVLKAVYVGRIIPHKRVDTLVDAVHAAPAWRLDVVGDGPGRKDVEDQVRRLGVNERVSLLGALDHIETLERVAKADVLVLASEYEGLPHVVVEALACGVPVVSADVGGVNEVVTHRENGLIVSPATSERFAQVLNDLATDADSLHHLVAAAKVRAPEWRLDTRVRELEDVLRDVCGRKPIAIRARRAG